MYSVVVTEALNIASDNHADKMCWQDQAFYAISHFAYLDMSIVKYATMLMPLTINEKIHYKMVY